MTVPTETYVVELSADERETLLYAKAALTVLRDESMRHGLTSRANKLNVACGDLRDILARARPVGMTGGSE